MWKLLERPKTLKVTRALAKSYADMEPAPHDRPLSERRLLVYQKLFERGEFRPVTWASALCKETGDVYRVNGKHTSTLLSGLDKIPEFWVTIEEYECDTLEDVAKLYSTFDSGMQSRTARDIYRSFAATVVELQSVPDMILMASITGVALHLVGLEKYSGTSPAERAEMILDYSDFAVWLATLHDKAQISAREIGSKQKLAHLLRQPVVAAMFAGWQKSRAAATEFWSQVANESSPKPADPSRKIARFLVTASMTRQATQSAKKTTSTREVYVKCLHAWNAWRKGESTNLNYYAESKVPAVY